MATRINAKTFDTSLDGEAIQIASASVAITDNTSSATTNGVPDGTLDGAVSASGSIVFDCKYFEVFKKLARRYGSFRSIPEMNLMFYANTGSEEEKIEVFGCKFSITDLLNIDKSSDDVTRYTVTFVVTAPEFIKIGGIPYLSDNDTRHLLNA